MMSDDDDFDYTSTNQSSKNLGSIFTVGESTPLPAVATAAYVPPKQPKKDSAPRVMIASVVQAFLLGADQKWAQKGKMGVALLSTDNTIFQLIMYVTKTQHVTSARISTSSVFTAQGNNYLSFQDDGGQSWSIMFETKQAIVDFALQIIVAKAYLFSFKFDSIIQNIQEGEGSALVDHDSVEILVHTYKFLENGTLQPNDIGENKPVRFKIGKHQNGKAFDDVLRGMKKNGQRITMIGTILYNIEVVRIKREKEARSSSITTPAEEQTVAERKRTITEDTEHNSEKTKMLPRLQKWGGVSMLPTQSAFGTLPSHLNDDNDSISNELAPRTITTPVPPVQFVPPGYHHPLHPHPQQANVYPQQQPNLYPQQQQPNPYPPQQQQPNPYPPQQQPNPYPPQPGNPYPPQQSLHDYNNRPSSAMSGLGYQQGSMWPHSQYPPTTQNVPPTDMFYPPPPPQQQQQPFQPDFRQLLNRLNEKVDVLNEKIDSKNNTTHPNMETSILLANIQRIVKENETVKKDLFDRSAKVEELNLKISELLDRNQRLIEQSHLTAEQRNFAVNNVSEETAKKILDLEKQKVELTNNLSMLTSKIADLQLQLNQFTQDGNETQSRISSLSHKCEQYKEDLQKSENQRLEIQSKFDTVQEQLKNEKTTRKQLQTNLNALEEELAEVKSACANLEKANNERKMKYENERKRWQDDIEDQKQLYEKELDELRVQLRKKRTTDNLTNNQEISRIEQDLEKEWQGKFERQQTQHERLLDAKGKELEQLKALLNENQTKLQQINEELDESKQQTQAYEERCEKLQERLQSMREKLIEITDEQPQLINEQVKRAINIIFQRLKTRIKPTKQYTGEQFLSRSLEIIKKATLKVLSNDDENDEQPSSPDIQSEDENEQIEKDDQPLNGDSVDQQTLNEEVSSIQTEQKDSLEAETLSSTIASQKNGWDTVDDFQQESKTQLESFEQNQIVLPSEDSISTVNQTETTTSDPLIENNQSILSSKTVEEEHDSDGNGDTIEENDEKSPSACPELEKPPAPELEKPPEPELEKPPASELEKSTEKVPSDDDDDEIFKSPRSSVQNVTPPQPSAANPKNNKFKQNIPLLTNLDDSDDEMFK